MCLQTPACALRAELAPRCCSGCCAGAWAGGGVCELSLGLLLCPQLACPGSFRFASIFTSWHGPSEWERDAGGGDVGMGVDEHNVIIGEISVKP